ncbi:MAG: hypothetical protein ACJ8IR_13420 [Alphaproteobacteria bacterium]|jgi:hypothetical protein
MLVRVFATFLAMTTTAAAYTQCHTTTIGGPGASIAPEGSNPIVTSGGKFVYAGFMQAGKLSLAISSDWGQTVAAPVTVYSGPGAESLLRLAASGTHVYALWQIRKQGVGSLLFAASDNNGASGSWTVTNLGSFVPNLPQISADGSHVYVFYHATDGNMVVRSSADYGRTLSDPVSLGVGAAEPALTAAGLDVYATWTIADPRADTMMAVSHDGGKTFKTTELSAERPSGSNEPIVTVDKIGGRVSLVWRENVPQQGVYLQSLDHGDTWSAPLVIDEPSREFMVADDGTYVYVTYLKKIWLNKAPDWQIQLAVSTDGGKTFQPATNLSGPTGIQSLHDDMERPMPWAWDGNGAFRVTGVKADGVYIWNGRNGVVYRSSQAYLGPGNTGAPAMNSVVWRAPNAFVSYGYCN